jgi:uncharacterized 2Fe-2S/4Fe-4S cluster protein (DUF4445 family)
LYIDTYDIESKVNTKLSGFLHHALRLTQNGEYMLAAETLKIMIESTCGGQFLCSKCSLLYHKYFLLLHSM